MSGHRRAMHVISIEERTKMPGYDGLSRGEPLLLLLQSFNNRAVIAQRATFAYKNAEPYIRIFVQLSTVLVIVHLKEWCAVNANRDRFSNMWYRAVKAVSSTYEAILYRGNLQTAA